ncbi:MAG: hypothetical protein KatS3mg124_0843 [Porticoccaceae bacterium]|nr:MAG: hypothetical protein KatS3mg124_0843 [Porticoccaceae bacterium]
MLRLLLALTLLATATARAENSFCAVLLGNTILCNDGSSYIVIGDHIFGNDGRVWTRMGNFIHGSDGRTWTEMGNFLHSDDGRTWTRIGNTVIDDRGNSWTLFGGGIRWHEDEPSASDAGRFRPPIDSDHRGNHWNRSRDRIGGDRRDPFPFDGIEDEAWWPLD